MTDELAAKRAQLANLALKEQSDECVELAMEILNNAPAAELPTLIVGLMIAALAAGDLVDMTRPDLVKVFAKLAASVEIKAQVIGG